MITQTKVPEVFFQVFVTKSKHTEYYFKIDAGKLLWKGKQADSAIEIKHPNLELPAA